MTKICACCGKEYNYIHKHSSRSFCSDLCKEMFAIATDYYSGEDPEKLKVRFAKLKVPTNMAFVPEVKEVVDKLNKAKKSPKKGE